jgi:NhaA family Na+:H+ antiporter
VISQRRLISSATAPGLVLAAATLAALVLSNSPWAGWYEALVGLRSEIRIANDWLVLSKPLLLWVNDLWMAVFFFAVALEIKREVLAGELASARQAALPLVAALGGMVVPALVYAVINRGDAVALRGSAIPMATDIAFALGVLLLLGSRVPASLKVFLTAVAIVDDLGAIVVIALFYTDDLSALMLLAASAGALVLLILNRAGVTRIGPYAVVGLILWVCVLKSGVHATLAGVVAALAIPLRDGDGGSPSAVAEHALQPWLGGVSLQTWTQGVPLGIAAGLVGGKAVGVFAASALLIRYGGARLPAGATWPQFFGVCVLCGIGFTMSLFIGSLAFEGQAPAYDTQVKVGVLAGSLAAGVLGVAILLMSARREKRG